MSLCPLGDENMLSDRGFKIVSFSGELTVPERARRLALSKLV